MANETVLFKRGDSATITSTPVTDGQILFDTSGNGKMYLDNGTDRLEMGGAITVDASLSKTSTNAIQNKAVTGNILNSLAEVSAATQQNTIAGALALKEVNSSLNELNNKRIVISSLINTVLTTEPKSLSTYNNLKISDYDLILVAISSNGTDIRDTKILSTRSFSEGYDFNLAVIHGSNSTNASDYKISGAFIQYVDDSTIKAKVGGIGILNHLEVFGIKLS